MVTGNFNFRACVHFFKPAYVSLHRFQVVFSGFKKASKIEPMSHTDTLKNKLEKLYDDPDEFLKVAREIGYDNLTSEQMNYVTAIEEAYEFRADPIKGTLEDGKHVLESMKGFVVGGYEFAKDTIQGTIIRALPVSIVPWIVSFANSYPPTTKPFILSKTCFPSSRVPLIGSALNCLRKYERLCGWRI